jgi:nitroreductase
METIIDSLKWRYATKKFDSSKKLTDSQLETLLESLRLSPSSFGLQPWKFVVVNNPSTREQLKEAAWNQPQVTDASHFVVLCSEKDLSQSLVDRYIKSAKAAHDANYDATRIMKYGKVISQAVMAKSADELRIWAELQIYIALGVILTTAAVEKIDTCPMEGFDRKKFDAILKLDEMGLESVVCVALGFRADDDSYSLEPKVRYSKEQIVVELN